MIVHRLFNIVVGKGPREDFERALYDHTKVVEFQESDGNFVALIATEGLTHDRAAYLAAFQSDRLKSFMRYYPQDVVDDIPTHSDMSEAFMKVFSYLAN
jgi:GTPase Era involved in 16S rRNA processing